MGGDDGHSCVSQHEIECAQFLALLTTKSGLGSLQDAQRTLEKAKLAEEPPTADTLPEEKAVGSADRAAVPGSRPREAVAKKKPTAAEKAAVAEPNSGRKNRATRSTRSGR